MDAKKHFSRVFVIESRIKDLQDKIEILRSCQAFGGGFGDSLGVQKSRNYRRAEDISVSIIETENELAKAKLRLLTLETQIRATTRGLQDPLARAVITWRYICRLKWKGIAARAQMSEMQIMRAHNAALAQMEQDVRNYELTNYVAN